MAKAKPDEETLTFRGSIAQLQTAISFSHDGSARIKIDLPQSDRVAAAALIEVQGCELEFVVRVVNQDEQQSESDTEDSQGSEKTFRKNFAF